MVKHPRRAALILEWIIGALIILLIPYLARRQRIAYDAGRVHAINMYIDKIEQRTDK